MPESVKDAPLSKGKADVILFFTDSGAELTKAFASLAKNLHPDGGLWICWPKQASKVPTDVNENLIRNVGQDAGLVDNKVCAVSEVWSGLRFVYRLRDRPRKPGR